LLGLDSVRSRRWWRRGPNGPARTAHLETYVSGCQLSADVPVHADGRFEALLTAELPPARRGWRVARNQLTCADHQAERCAVVLVPPAEAVTALAVLLPLAGTFPEGGAGQLARLDAAGRLGPVLHRLAEGAKGARPIYYLAAVPGDDEGRPRELALALASLGWPAGHIVPMPAPTASAAPLVEGLDRLRWLFADALDLLVINLEREAVDLLRTGLEVSAERARVRHLAGPGDNLWGLVAKQGEKNGPLVLGPRPSRAGRVARYPLVFCHGMLAFSTLHMQLPDDLNSFSSLRPFLQERGFRALFPQVIPTGGVIARAHELRAQILRWTDEPVNIIAHSMGGLDARYLITHLGLAERVRSLTTLATPHRGTWLADWFIANYRHRVPLLLAMEALGTNVDGFQDCRPAACVALNAATPDMPGVRYFSYGGAVPQERVCPMLRRPWQLLSAAEGPNDGMVSLASARWGEYLGTMNADHFAQTPDSTFLNPEQNFDSLGFCLKVIEDLAYRGF
jgi:triacylglycerol lipase